jgi:hypothetical protein
VNVHAKSCLTPEPNGGYRGRLYGRLGSGSGRRVSTLGAWAVVQPYAETVPSPALRRAVPLKGCRARHLA